jgi:hypothetical protein
MASRSYLTEHIGSAVRRRIGLPNGSRSSCGYLPSLTAVLLRISMVYGIIN